MDETEQDKGQDQQIQQRVIATLLALAVLVERLCHYPRPVRRLVLWILRYAEKVAREFVFRKAFEHGVRALPTAIFAQPAKQGRDEAARLAFSFRAMAWALQHMQGGALRYLPPGGWRGLKPQNAEYFQPAGFGRPFASALRRITFSRSLLPRLREDSS